MNDGRKESTMTRYKAEAKGEGYCKWTWLRVEISIPLWEIVPNGAGLEIEKSKESKLYRSKLEFIFRFEKKGATFREVYCDQVNKPLSSIGRQGGWRDKEREKRISKGEGTLKTSKLNSTSRGTLAGFKVHPYSRKLPSCSALLISHNSQSALIFFLPLSPRPGPVSFFTS